MRWEYRTFTGGEFTVDTATFDYDEIWKSIHLRKAQRPAANRIIDFYHLRDSQDRPSSHQGETFRGTGRWVARHQVDYYRTRQELDEVSGQPKLIDRLIKLPLLELHHKWEGPLMIRRKYPDGLHISTGLTGHKKHPQAPYRLYVPNLFRLSEGIDLSEVLNDATPLPPRHDHLMVEY